MHKIRATPAAVLVLIPLCALCIPGCAQTEQAGPNEFLLRSRGQRHTEVAWRKAISLDFDDPGELKRYPIPAGRWEIRGGKLWAVGGDRNHAILLVPCKYHPVRIEFEATSYASEDRIGDITVLLNSAPGKNWWKNGYALTTGSYWNNCTTFYRRAKPFARTEFSPVRPGKPNKVAVEFHAGHVRYWFNDRIVLEAWDEAPLAMDGRTWIGIRTWGTRMSVDNVADYRGRTR